ncbi:MAG: exodeoxyribonuclease VII small subunit [Akkermansia sp.]|nr:exodeoxyribonuclease VII small subunit [Akkermansia sp.]MBQ2868829.1 exodeoxyribonuclease VII small subunit [Akkermansia sp.]MBQ8376100.1 exodeoxyribonuclease VII small subunit [Akkermansia sp.]MBQ8899776.1 exodeoxyribonuclease VII small subunit [Akkermansia sp.]
MSPRAKAKSINFEQATARLEEIVNRVNNPETGLEEMISLAEEGLTLIRSSEQLLAEAELKIQKLEQADTAPTQQKPLNDDAEFSLI